MIYTKRVSLWAAISILYLPSSLPTRAVLSHSGQLSLSCFFQVLYQHEQLCLTLGSYLYPVSSKFSTNTSSCVSLWAAISILYLPSSLPTRAVVSHSGQLSLSCILQVLYQHEQLCLTLGSYLYPVSYKFSTNTSSCVSLWAAISILYLPGSQPTRAVLSHSGQLSLSCIFKSSTNTSSSI